MMMEKAMQQGAFPSGGGGGGLTASPGPPVADPFGEKTTEELFPCSTCGRRMTSRALGPHSNACGKGPRKKFDTAKHRVEGTEAAEFVKKAKRAGKEVANRAAKKSDVNVRARPAPRADPCPFTAGGERGANEHGYCHPWTNSRACVDIHHSDTSTPPPALPCTCACMCMCVCVCLHVSCRESSVRAGLTLSVPRARSLTQAPKPKEGKWRDQSSAFREAMKNARAVTAALATGGPMPDAVPSAPDPSLVQCPHCARRFNATAAERHIPKCTSIKAKPTMLKAGSRQGLGATARGEPAAAPPKRAAALKARR